VITGALLCHNEADRYLERVLINAGQFCDHIVAIDDGSDDATEEVLEYHGVEVVAYRALQSFWGHNETTPRKLLWNAARAVDPDGWIYVFDADHELMVDEKDFAQICRSDTVDAWAFRLWDCWDREDQMRQDEFWQAHWSSRPWLYRALEGTWATPRGIHTGHAPLRDWIVGEAPGAIRHLGYVKQEHRKLKMDKYLALA